MSSPLSPAAEFRARYELLPFELQQRINSQIGADSSLLTVSQNVSSFRNASLLLPVTQFLQKLEYLLSLSRFRGNYVSVEDVENRLTGDFYNPDDIRSLVEAFIAEVTTRSRESSIANLIEFSRVLRARAALTNGNFSEYNFVYGALAFSPPIFEKLLELDQLESAMTIFSSQYLRPQGLSLLRSKGLLRYDKLEEFFRRYCTDTPLAMYDTMQILLLNFLACSDGMTAREILTGVYGYELPTAKMLVLPLAYKSSLDTLLAYSVFQIIRRRDVLEYLEYVGLIRVSLDLGYFMSWLESDAEEFAKQKYLGRLPDLTGLARWIMEVYRRDVYAAFPSVDAWRTQMSLVENGQLDLATTLFTGVNVRTTITQLYDSLSDILSKDIQHGGREKLLDKLLLHWYLRYSPPQTIAPAESYYRLIRYPVTGPLVDLDAASVKEELHLEILLGLIRSGNVNEYQRFFLGTWSSDNIQLKYAYPRLLAALGVKTFLRAYLEARDGIRWNAHTEYIDRDILPLPLDPELSSLASRNNEGLPYGTDGTDGDFYQALLHIRLNDYRRDDYVLLVATRFGLTEILTLLEKKIPEKIAEKANLLLRAALTSSAKSVRWLLEKATKGEWNLGIQGKHIRRASSEVRAVLAEYGLKF